MYCPNAEAGLTVCEGLYHPSQFNFISYHSSGIGGQLYNADSMVRVNYYGASALPEIDFDATQEVVGAGSDARDGHYYTPIINNHMAQSVPVKVEVPEVSYNGGSSYVDVVVTLYGELTTIANTFVRVAVVEDVVFNGTHYANVVRDMVPTPSGTALTIQHTGEVQTLHLPFTMGTWNPANMAVVAFVQRDSDKYIYNSGSSASQPYQAVLAVNGAQQMLAGDAPMVFGTTNITNYGTMTDTYDITLDTSTLPEGWDAYFTYDGVDGVSATVTLNQFQQASLVVTMVPASIADARVHLNVFSHGAGHVISTLDFVAVNGSGQILLVADDGGAGLADQYFGPAVTASGRTISVWDQSISGVNGATLNQFDAVVWFCGGTNPGLQAADRTALDTFLLGGGRAILTGQDVAQDLYTEGGGANMWLQLRTLCRYLPAGASNLTVNGVAGDPIGDGLSFAISGGDGANNQTDPDVIQGLTSAVVPVFNYGTGTLAGMRVENDAYKMVFLAFGLEAIDSAAMRNEVMDNSLDWLIGDNTTPVNETPAALALAHNTPNPFNPATKIAFALDRTGPVRLAIFDLQGRLVRTLVDESLVAGTYDRVWDGRDDAGQPAASGAYVYRLTADGQTLSHKMTLLK